MLHGRTLAMALIVSLLIATASHAGEVTGFTLIDTRNNRDIGPLEDGGAFDRPIIGSAGNLRANVSGDVESVQFAVDGQVVRTESAAPYAVAGDNQGEYNEWRIPAGKHTLTVTPYPKAGAKGQPGKALKVTFTVKGMIGDAPPKRGNQGDPPVLKPIVPAQTVACFCIGASRWMTLPGFFSRTSSRAFGEFCPVSRTNGDLNGRVTPL